MATAANQFRPDYAMLPGSILEERLAVAGISPTEFAVRCGLSPTLISEIIAGTAPLQPDTALQFEKVLGVAANVWLGLESEYQLGRAREAEARAAVAALPWASAFPVRMLVKRGCFESPVSDLHAVRKLLTFFRVGTVEAWIACYGLAGVEYRRSGKFRRKEAALATWLRLGEISAEGQACREYNPTRFEHAVREIRRLTREPIVEAVRQAERLCNEGGVALALVPPLPRLETSALAWWMSLQRVAILLTPERHRTEDHFWFSFFHEAARILLLGKKDPFFDDTSDTGDEQETDTHAWASDILVPRAAWEEFVSTSPRSAEDVSSFAEQQGIAPGIVVALLQVKGHLPRRQLNDLKVRLDWKSLQ